MMHDVVSGQGGTAKLLRNNIVEIAERQNLQSGPAKLRATAPRTTAERRTFQGPDTSRGKIPCSLLRLLSLQKPSLYMRSARMLAAGTNTADQPPAQARC